MEWGDVGLCIIKKNIFELDLKAWEGIYEAQTADWSHKEVITWSWSTCRDWRLGSKMSRIIWGERSSPTWKPAWDSLGRNEEWAQR